MTPPRTPGGAIFYGWRVVAASGAGLALSFPTVVIYPFGNFVRPLAAEFGWNRGDISAALMIAILTTAVAGPGLGMLIDRFGVRRVLLPAILLFGLASGSLYWLTPSLAQFYATFFVIAVVGTVVSPLGYSRVIVSWFDRHRGLALGIGLAGVGIGAAAVSPAVQAVIGHFGWRHAYIGLGLLILFISFPIVFAVLRDSPGEMGLGADGDSPAPDDGESNARAAGFTARDAARTAAFWLMLGAFFLVGLAMTGIIVHLVPMLIDRGMTPARAALATTVLGMSLIFGRLLAGYLMDRFFAPNVAIVFLAGPILGLGMLAMGASGGLAYVSAALVGMAIGAEFDVIAYFTSRYFGPRAYGQIYGYLFALFQIGGAMGPVIMGYGFDSLGNYTMALWLLSGLMALACLLIRFLGPYPTLPRPLRPAQSGG